MSRSDKEVLNKRLGIPALILLVVVIIPPIVQGVRSGDPYARMGLVMGLIFSLIFLVVGYFLSKKRPDLLNKWSSGEKWAKQLTQNKNQNDIKVMAKVYSRWWLDTVVGGTIAGVIIVTLMLLFAWYANTYWGWDAI